MAKNVDEITEEIRKLPNVEKLRLGDTILSELDKPDPEIDQVSAEEARKRWSPIKPARRQLFLTNPSWPNTAARNLLSCRIRDSEVVLWMKISS